MANVHERRDAAKNAFDLHLANRQTAVTATAAALGPTSASHVDLEKQLQGAVDELEAVAGHINFRKPNILVHNMTIFWLASVSVFVIEAVINKVVVDMAAETSGGMSLLVAALISITLVALAHWAGHLWRQIWSDSQQRMLVGNIILGLLLVFVVSAAVLAIMALRAYFALVNTAAVVNVFSDAIATIQELGLDFVLRAFTVPESVTIGGLNILALLVAFLFGFFSHDSDHQYDVALREEAKARKTIRRQVAKYERQLETIFRQFKYRIQRAQAAFVANKGDLETLQEDNFKAQRFEAEGTVGEGSTSDFAAASSEEVTNITVLTPKSASGNPW